MNTTSVTLLERLRQPGQPEAWARLVELYTPLLLHWARRLGLQAQDAADLVQDVFVLLVQKLPAFTYDHGKTFRGWLRTVLHHKWQDRQRRKEVPRATANEGDLAELAAPDTCEAVAEEEERRYLMRRALELMQAEFKPTTWKACWEFVVEGRPAAEVAANLSISTNAVHIATCRVLARLRQEMAGLVD